MFRNLRGYRFFSRDGRVPTASEPLEPARGSRESADSRAVAGIFTTFYFLPLQGQ